MPEKNWFNSIPKIPAVAVPFYKISYVFQGRFTSRHVSPAELKTVRLELANHKRLRKLAETGLGWCCVWLR